MVKTLKRKFIFASMLAVTILLVTLVGAINILYCYSVYRQEKTRLGSVRLYEVIDSLIQKNIREGNILP